MTRFGFQIINFAFPGVSDDKIFERVRKIAVSAEEAGFDSLWVQDHFYTTYSQGPPENPTLENYVLLGALAAATTRVRLGTLASAVTYRNPALLAKMMTSLDCISAGRAILGIGAGWNKVEHHGMGYHFPEGGGERWERLEEALQICRLMFTEERPSFEGKHYRIHEVLNYPRPIQPGGPPILVGGRGPKRTLRLLAKYGDMSNLYGGVDAVKESLDIIRAHCEAVGRDPATIIQTRMAAMIVSPTREEAQRKSEHYRQMTGLPEDFWNGFVMAGTPDDVCEDVQRYLDLGLDELQFSLYDAHEIDPIYLAGETLLKNFG